MTIYPPLFVLCVLGVYTKGTILPVRPDRRLYSRDRCQWLLLPTARHPACAGYILWHLRAQCTLALPGQSGFVPVCVCCEISCGVCGCVHAWSNTSNKLYKKPNSVLQTSCTSFDRDPYNDPAKLHFLCFVCIYHKASPHTGPYVY